MATPTVSSSLRKDALREDAARAFAAQRAHVRRHPTPPADVRRDHLERLRAALLDRRDDFHAALYDDFCKPPEEVDLTEIQPLLAEIDHALDRLADWMAPQPVGTPVTLLGTASAVRYEPKGVVLILAPWNYPVNLTLSPLVAALAAGNSAVLKPSEYTPHTSALLGELVAGLYAPEVVTLIEGDATVAQALLEQPFDHIFFTGSPAVGKIVMRAAAEHLASVTLELGGKSPVLVDATADVDDAARKIVWGKFTNAGQTCIAPDYVLAHADVHAELVYALGRHVRRFYGLTAEERQASPDYARLVGDRHYERVTSLLRRARAAGARVALGGVVDAATRYVAPTVLTDVPLDAALMQEEIFGPLLPVLSYETTEEALGVIHDRPHPLALYVFSRDDEAIEEILDRTTAGSTCVNDTLLQYVNPELPFGGAGHSGIGRSHGRAGFEAFSNARAVMHRKHSSAALELLFPPYGGAVQRVIGAMSRWL